MVTGAPRAESDGGLELRDTALSATESDANAAGGRSSGSNALEAETLGRGVRTSSCPVGDDGSSPGAGGAGGSGARHRPSGSGGTGGTGEVGGKSDGATARLCRFNATPLDETPALRALNGLFAGTGGVELGAPGRACGGTLSRRFDIGGGGGAMVSPGDLRVGEIWGDFGVLLDCRLDDPLRRGNPDGGGEVVERLGDDSVPKPCGPGMARDGGDEAVLSDGSVASKEARISRDGDASSLRGMRLREETMGVVNAAERLSSWAEPRLEGGPGDGPPRGRRCDPCACPCADLCLPFDRVGDDSRDAARLAGADDRGVVLWR